MYTAKYGFIAKQTVQIVLIGFYDVDSIIEAKRKFLLDIVKRCKVGISRYPHIIAHTDEAKEKSECDDLIVVYKVLDVEKCNLPRFAVEEVDKFLTIKTSDVDVNVLDSINQLFVSTEFTQI